MNKQELIEKWESAIEAAEFYGEGKEEEIIYHTKDFVEDLKKLETLSKEWIDEHEEQEEMYGTYGVPVRKLKNLLVPKQEITEEQIGALEEEWLANAVESGELGYYGTKYDVIKRELPVIPQFVADFVEYTSGWFLYEVFDDEWLQEKHDDVYAWLYDNDDDAIRERELGLVAARARGYEIEQEPKYYVLDREDVPLLSNIGYGVFRTHTNLSIHEKGRSNDTFALTDKEIKDFDPRFWAFAVPVEEVDADG